MKPALVAAVATGGALGATLRYLMARAMGDGGDFPRATFVVNVTGCLLFGFLAGWLAEPSRETVAALVLTGILGGYTTFSAFASETVALLSRRPILAIVYVLASVIAGIAAIAIGNALRTQLVSR